jgi:hypothetical protein
LAIATAGFSMSAVGTALAANVRPDAGFGLFPRTPASQQTVQFVSYACDPDGRLSEQAWDLDDDGSFDDALGSKAARSYAPGSHRVKLRVTDRRGKSAVRERIFEVSPDTYVDPFPSPTPLLSPFPFVRLSGSVSGTLTRIGVLSVRAPVCSKAKVLCKGQGCRRKRVTKLVGRKPARFRAIERSFLAAGATIKVFVTKRDRIGKYTRFRFRAGKAPSRVDRCLRFGAKRGVRCPSS